MRLRSKFIILLLLLFSFIPNVFALGGKITYNSTTIGVGDSKNIEVRLDNSSDVQAIGGSISVEDSSCIRINSISETNGSAVNGNVFALPSFGEIPSGTKFAIVNVTGLKECSTKLTFPNATLTSTSSEEMAATIVSPDIVVKNPTQQVNNTPTTNNSTNNTNVVTTTPKQEQNTVSSTPVVNNTSNKTVNNQSNNQISNNSQIAVNQIDLTLSTLSIDGYNIGFNKNKLDYVLEVENNIESLNIDAKATDNNSNVKIEGNDKLLVGENIVKVIVSNNNGQKIYTIKVNRKQDPTKTYNTDNYLTNIVPSIGILSPKFDKDKLNYIIYLPYEEDKITFENTLSAPDTSTIEVEGPENLNIGDNKYVIKVRAESGDIREYTVIVRKANIYNDSSNNFLKSITLENGKLTSDFDKNKTTYYYTKGNGFKYNFELEDPNATVEVYDDNGVITFIVTAPNGDIRVYTLVEKNSDLIKCLLLVALSIVMGFLIKCLIIELKKNKKKKLKKENK